MYATEEEAQTFYAGEDAETLRLSAIMAAAAGIVAQLAPAPDPSEAGDEYPDLAKSTELLTGEYLWETKGYVSGEGVSGISASYRDFVALIPVIRGVMGDFYTGGGSNVGYFEAVPW